MSSKKAFIFDLDGVLVFTDQLHYQAWKTVADELQIYFDEEINQRLRGVSRMESLAIIMERYEGLPLTQLELEQIAERKNTIYKGLLESMNPSDVTDEVRETLRTLRERGYLLAVGSSSRNAKLILKKTELTSFFDVISDGTNISRSKPDPEVFVKAAEYLGADPKVCSVVEDADAGLRAAKAANMRAIGIGDAINESAADVVITSILDLLKL